MKSWWESRSLTTKILIGTVSTVLIVLSSLAYWIGDQMRSSVRERLQERSLVIQKQIEVTRAYLTTQYIAKIKNAGEGTIKIAQDHAAPDTVPLPATATREMSEDLSKEGFYSARVISRTPLNAANRPQGSFEEEAIKALEAGEKEVTRVEPVDGIMMFRRLTPDIIKSDACISCHAGKKMGEMVGAISIQIPMTKALAQIDHSVNILYTASGISAVILAGVLFVLLRSQVLGPIQRLGSVVEQLTTGNYGARVTVSNRDEIGETGRAFNTMAEQLHASLEEQKKAMAEVKGITHAVNKAQAAIEFNLDGTVLTANDNFLAALGYQLAEIQGQHHRLFCEPAYAASGDYQTLWAKLARGEFEVGTYRFLGKGGKDVWLQASYNPILDAHGKPYKVVKFASDITAQKRAQLEQEHLVTEAQTVLGALAQGDLTQHMAGTYQGELDNLKLSVNTAITTLLTTLTTVRAAAESVSTGAEQITRGNEDLSQRTAEQASALEETSASMEEMTSTVKQNADNAKQANQLAIAARDIADKGGAITTRAVSAMEEINKSSKKIADIITVIDEIAFQTNLLALNAAVEAARAGEHGRGFAVVAAEVRNLAQRSATAAKEIKGLINESIQRVTDGSELVNQSGKTLDEIVGSVKRVTDIIAEIAAASQEQAQGIDQVTKAVSQMDETTQQNAALVEETTSASQSMKEQAQELTRQVGRFKLTDTDRGQGQVSSPAPRPAAKPVAAKPKAAAPKPEPAPAAVGAGNGHDRRRKDDDFEEF